MTFRATYTLTAATGDPAGNGTVVWYRNGADRQRYDITAVQDGESTEITIIQAPDAAGVCFKSAGDLAPILGVGPDDGVCLNDNAENGAGLGDLSDVIDDMPNQEGVAKSARTIAGSNAACYQTRSRDGATTDACFSGAAEVLYLRDADGATYEATSLDGNVSPADFKLPYEVREAPGLGD